MGSPSISKSRMLGKNSVTFISIDADAAGQRLDNWLFTQLKGVPKSHVYLLIRSGQVRINGKRADQTSRLVDGDQVRLPPVRVAEKTAAQSAAPAAVFPIVYEDDALLVIDKPAGVAVHGGSGVSFGVIEQLRSAHPDWKYLELVHRLDRETSGLLMVAKRRSALVKLHEMMRANVPDKRYYALVHGVWKDPKRAVKLALHKYNLPDGERRVRAQEDGIAAHTIFRLQQNYTTATLLEAELKTGRTHQIRVHLASIGYPILGDEKYGDFALNKSLHKQGLKRMFLHAWNLKLPHPLTGVALDLQAALPPELTSYLEHLHASV